MLRGGSSVTSYLGITTRSNVRQGRDDIYTYMYSTYIGCLLFPSDLVWLPSITNPHGGRHAGTQGIQFFSLWGGGTAIHNHNVSIYNYTLFRSIPFILLQADILLPYPTMMLIACSWVLCIYSSRTKGRSIPAGSLLWLPGISDKGRRGEWWKAILSVLFLCFATAI